MHRVFVDTHGWANFLDEDEEGHEAAVRAFGGLDESGASFVTSNYVLTELVALLTRSRFRISRRQLIRMTREVRGLPNLKTIHVDEEIDDLAWKLFEARPDKEWSLVDCSSFVIMEQLGIREALTADHHFEQAGFRCLLPVARPQKPR